MRKQSYVQQQEQQEAKEEDEEERTTSVEGIITIIPQTTSHSSITANGDAGEEEEDVEESPAHLNRLAVIDLFEGTKGRTAWKKANNWCIRNFLGSWFGLTDEDHDGQVTAIVLPRNGLQGERSEVTNLNAPPPSLPPGTLIS